jgi:hypothetical protein
MVNSQQPSSGKDMSWRAKMEQKESKPITGKIIFAFSWYRTTTAKKI